MLLLSAVAIPVTGAGCSGYTLRGKVVRGDISYATIVEADDVRFEDAGMSGVRIALQSNPGRLNRERIGETFTDSAGEFAIRVDRFGAGMLNYEVSFEARRKGYEGVRQMFTLPSRKKRIFVMLHPGEDVLGPEEESLDDEFERFRFR